MRSVILVLFLSLTSLQFAQAATKTYQVTGPVTEVTASTITVDKGGEKWTLQKDAATKTKGDVKVGSKVTIKYTMTATEVEAKADKKSK